jgi:2-(1,2-epoxy-1,2-dihydrophenyl)acetyl-CoA isomerase
MFKEMVFMAHKTVLVTKENRVATLTLNRPEKLNAVNRDMFKEVPQALDQLAKDSDVSTVILTGAGRAFCAGADIELLDTITTPYKARHLMADAAGLVLSIRNLPKPIIAAVNGVAAGGAVALAIACDIVVASEKASFGPLFSNIGLYPDTGLTYFLPRLVGPAKACEIMLLGDAIDSAEAQRIGLISHVVSSDQLESTVKALASRLAERPQFLLESIKAAAYGDIQVDLPACLEREAEIQTVCFFTDEHKERVKGFLR